MKQEAQSLWKEIVTESLIPNAQQRVYLAERKAEWQGDTLVLTNVDRGKREAIEAMVDAIAKGSGRGIEIQVMSGPPLAHSAYTILTTEYPEPTWAVNDFLPAGLAVLAGKAKLGKSWLALQLAQAVATGGHALDRKVEKGTVLYLALEDTERRLKGRMLKQGWPATHCPAYLFCKPWFDSNIGNLNNGGCANLANLIADWQPRLTVVDTFSRAFGGGDQNDTSDVTMVLEPIQQAALDANGVVLILDHHNKGFASMDAVANVLGSTAKGAIADTLWGLYRERGKPEAKLAITGRDVTEVTLEIKFDVLSGCWQLESTSNDIPVTDSEQEILDWLQSREGLYTEGQISEGLDRNRGNTYKRLQELTAKGLLVSTDSPKGKRYAVRR